MARISEENMRGFLTDDGYSICFFCENEIKKGGCWTGRTDIGVCDKCSEWLIDLFIDTNEDCNIDFKNLSIDEKEKYISCVVRKRLEKKINVEKFRREIENQSEI